MSFLCLYQTLEIMVSDSLAYRSRRMESGEPFSL